MPKRMVKNATLSDLRRLMLEKEKELAELQKTKNSLLKQLATVDAGIEAVTGGPLRGRPPMAGDRPAVETAGKPGRKAKGAVRRRPKNAERLPAVIDRLLSSSKAGMTLSELEEAVFDTGYKSNSKKFKNVLYQAIYKMPKIKHNSETGKYMVTAAK